MGHTRACDGAPRTAMQQPMSATFSVEGNMTGGIACIAARHSLGQYASPFWQVVRVQHKYYPRSAYAQLAQFRGTLRNGETGKDALLFL